MGEPSGFDMEVTGLYNTGKKISGRSANGGSAAKGMREGLDTAGGKVGHSRVRNALAAFVTDNVLDQANQLPVHLENGGNSVSRVPATARDEDTSKAAGLKAPIAGAESYSGRINRQV